MIAALAKDASGLRAAECSEKWARVRPAQVRPAQVRPAQDLSLNPRLQALDWTRRCRSRAQVSRPGEWAQPACASAHRA